MTANWKLPLIVLAAIAMVAAGCGDSSDGSENGNGGSDQSSNSSDSLPISTSVRTGPLEKPEFLKRANKVCYDAKARQAADLARYLRENKERTWYDPGTEAVETILIPSVREQIIEVRDLGAPAGDTRPVEAFLAALQKSTEVIEDQNISKSAPIRRTFRPAGDLAQKYGLDGCAYGH